MAMKMRPDEDTIFSFLAGGTVKLQKDPSKYFIVKSGMISQDTDPCLYKICFVKPNLAISCFKSVQ